MSAREGSGVLPAAPERLTQAGIQPIEEGTLEAFDAAGECALIGGVCL